MFSKKRGYGIGFATVILTAALLGYFTGVKPKAGGEAFNYETRTVQLDSKINGIDLDRFASYDLTERADGVSFSGTLPFTLDVVEPFNNVSLIEDENEENLSIAVDCAFDMETLQMNLSVAVVTEDGEVLDTLPIQTDVFITEFGGLDARIEVLGENFLLSDFRNQSAINEVGWLDKIKNPIKTVSDVILGPVIVIVLNTAEMIKSDENYDYNKKLESSGKGVSLKNFITDQTEYKRTGYNSSAYQFGFAKFDKVGCEIASAYNLMIKLGRPDMLSKTIRDFEQMHISIAIGFGHFGSDPYKIGKYLDKKGVAYNTYLTRSSLKGAVENKYDAKFIMSTMNSGFSTELLSNGCLHTWYAEKKDDQLISYNLKPRTNNVTHADFNELTTGGMFLVGYVIK